MNTICIAFVSCCAVSFLVAPGFALAAQPTTANDAPPAGGPPRARDPQFEAALKACEASLQVRGSERPDRDRMRLCMSEKGYAPPAGRGPGAEGKDRPPPARDDAS